jgi:hypothetical protein
VASIRQGEDLLVVDRRHHGDHQVDFIRRDQLVVGRETATLQLARHLPDPPGVASCDPGEGQAGHVPTDVVGVPPTMLSHPDQTDPHRLLRRAATNS